MADTSDSERSRIGGSFGGEVSPELVNAPPLAVFDEGLLHVAARLGRGVECTDEPGMLGFRPREEPSRHPVGIARLHPGEVDADAELAPLVQLEADVVGHALGEPKGDIIPVGLEHVDQLMDDQPRVIGVRGDPLRGDVDGIAVPVGDAIHLPEDNRDGSGMDLAPVGAEPEGVGHLGFPFPDQGLRPGSEGLQLLIRPLVGENDLHIQSGHRNRVLYYIISDRNKGGGGGSRDSRDRPHDVTCKHTVRQCRVCNRQNLPGTIQYASTSKGHAGCSTTRESDFYLQ